MIHIRAQNQALIVRQFANISGLIGSSAPLHGVVPHDDTEHRLCGGAADRDKLRMLVGGPER
jgi:hypothetical protein